MNGNLVYLGGKGYMIFLCQFIFMNAHFARVLLAVAMADFMIADCTISQWVNSGHIGLFLRHRLVCCSCKLIVYYF